MVSALFKKLISGYTFGEIETAIQKAKEPAYDGNTWKSQDGTLAVSSDGRVSISDMVLTATGEWCPASQAVRIPRNGKFVWVRW